MRTNHFKNNKTGDIFGYEGIDELVGYTRLSMAEVNKLINPTSTQEQLATIEKGWADEQLDDSNKELELTIESSKRAKYTVESIYLYKEALRDYVELVDDVLTVKTDKPKANLLVKL